MKRIGQTADLHVQQTLTVYALHLLVIGTIWILSRFQPSKPRFAALAALLTLTVLSGINMAAALVKFHAAADLPWEAWIWRVKVTFAANLLIAAAATWGILQLRPWRLLQRADEPVSPATRRTGQLFGLSGVVAVLAVAVLAVGTDVGDGQSAVWSNSQNLSPGFALAAIAIYLVALALGWWWYRSADEHERRANDVGFLAGGGLFMAATPVWWILSRAGLASPPDAMILWYATMVAMGIGSWRYRSR